MGIPGSRAPGAEIFAEPVCYAPGYVFVRACVFLFIEPLHRSSNSFSQADGAAAAHVSGGVSGLDDGLAGFLHSDLLRSGDCEGVSYSAVGGARRGVSDPSFPAGGRAAIWNAGGSLRTAAGADGEHSELLC